MTTPMTSDSEHIATKCDRCGQPFIAGGSISGNESGTWHTTCPKAQSEAPSVETLEEILMQVNCWCLHDRGCTIIEEQQKAIAKINRLIVEARKDEARILHNNLDHYFNIIERIQPGYKGDTTIDVKSLQKVLCEHRDRLSNNLSKGDV